jgi:hypothetical protein
MTVKEFVEDTLVQIVEGVQAAQLRIAKSGAAINRHGMTLMYEQLEGRRYDPLTAEVEELVRFDIAVTVEGGTGTKGGVGVFLGAVALGSQGQSSSKDAQVSRVQFAVPVVYPATRRPE